MTDIRLAPVRAYLRRHAHDPDLLRLGEQLELFDAMFTRSNMMGHITASGLVITPDQREAVVIDHKGLNKWLQPGGHVDDDDPAIWRVAYREIQKETGIWEMALHPWHAAHDFEPIDIDTHAIPARPSKGEGEHWHHDCLYAFVAPKIALKRQEEEVFAALWCAINGPRVPETSPSSYSLIPHFQFERL